MKSDRFPRTMQEAFGPHTDDYIEDLLPPHTWVSNCCIGLVAIAFISIAALCGYVFLYF